MDIWIHAATCRTTLRTPEATSIGRAHEFNKKAVEKFFLNHTNIINKHGPFLPHRIYNVDETGITTVQTIAEKGKKQVGQIAAAER